jgi:hypothetical protein
MAKQTQGPWQIREALTLEGGVYYSVTRIVNRRRVHMEYAKDGKPILYSLDRAEAAIAAATEENNEVRA